MLSVGRARDAEWSENKHPRGQPDNAGQFGSGGVVPRSEKHATGLSSYAGVITATKFLAMLSPFITMRWMVGASRISIPILRTTAPTPIPRASVGCSR